MTGSAETVAWALAAAGIGLAFLTTALAFRLGVYRRPARLYWNSQAPWYLRNGAFMLVPAGLFVLLILAYPLASMIDDPVIKRRADGLVTAALFSQVLLALAWVRHPPQFLKPLWLVEAERLRPPPTADDPSRVDRVFIGCITIGAVALAALGIWALLPW